MLDHGGTVLIGRAENVQAAALVFFHDHLGGFRIGCRTDDGRKTGGRTVDELDASLTENRVVGRTEPDLAGFDVRFFGVQVKIRFLEISQGFVELECQQGSHTGIQQWSEVGYVVVALYVGRQQPAGKIQGLFHVLQCFDLQAEQGVNDRQEVGGVGKSDFGVRVVGLQSFLVSSFNLGNDVVTTLNGGECNKS